MNFTHITMDDGGCYKVRYELYDECKTAYMKGKTFIEVVDIYGSIHTIKLSRVTSISKFTEESLARWRDEQKEKALE